MCGSSLLVIFTSCLDGFGTVDLLQDHDPGQVVRESHWTHGQLEICLCLDLGCNTERRADEKAGAAFAGQLHLFQLVCESFAGKGFTLRSKDAEPSTFGKLGQDLLRFLVQSCGNLGGGGILRETVFRQLDQMKIALALQSLGIFFRGGQIKLFLQFAHGDQCDVEHSFPPFGLS